MRQTAISTPRTEATERSTTPAREVLVTGGTGFVGSYLVDELLRNGYRVRSTGRRLEAGARLAASGATFRPVDMTDTAAVRAVCDGVDTVVHVAAATDPWGPWERFRAVNVDGTAAIIDGCRRHGVDRLVYVSSPSVLFRFRDQFDLDTTDSPPADDRFASPYARSKWMGEELVRDCDDLETVVVRPKAVYGPGDPTLFPRLLAAARRGVLPKIAGTETKIQLTYVEDVARALRRAVEAPEAADGTYHVTGEQPVELWPVVEKVFARLDVPGPAFELDRSTALQIASLCETVWNRLPLPGEPPLTPYKVGLLSFSQTYDGTATRRDLDWRPRVSIHEGIRRFTEQWDEKPDPAPGLDSGEAEASATSLGPVPPAVRSETRVRFELLCGGVCEPPGAVFASEAGIGTVEVPALFGLLEHPDRGIGLFDTGYSRRFLEATESFPARLYRWLTPPRLDDAYPARDQLRRRGIAPEEVDWILLSHFDPDHYGGLRDFPNAEIVCSAEAWRHVRHKSGLAALRARLLPGHLPDDLSARLRLVHRFDDEGVGPFGATDDLFGDGSIRLAPLPGHAPGQYGAFLRTERHGPVFLAADGVWTRRHLDSRPFRTRAHRLVAADTERQRATYERLWSLRREAPEWTLVPSHCPAAAEQFDVSTFANQEEL